MSVIDVFVIPPSDRYITAFYSRIFRWHSQRMWCQINGSDRVQFILLNWGNRAWWFLKVLKERPHSGCNSFLSRAVLYGHMASESFSLALQQRAAREVVSEEMPRRALATRLLIFGEITSALLIIELGLFYQFWWMVFGLIIVPILLVVRMGLYVVMGMGFFAYAAVGVRWSLGGRWNSNGFFFSDLPFASVFTNPGYSSFGFRRGQKGNSLNVLTIMLTRVACAAILVYVVLNACGAKQPQNLYQCECRSTRCKSFTSSGACDERECSLYRLYMFDEIAIYSSFPETQDLCRHFEHLAEDEFREVHLCNAVRLPTMLNRTCEAGYMDALAYYRCTGQNSFYPELCDVKFRGCGIFNEEAYLDILILQLCCLAPLMGLALMVLIHLAWFIVAKQTNQPSLMNVSENSELRLRIRRKACHFEQQLQKEQLEQSIWCLGQNCIMDWWWVSVNIVSCRDGDHFETSPESGQFIRHPCQSGTNLSYRCL